jgi:hypothetical protein
MKAISLWQPWASLWAIDRKLRAGDTSILAGRVHMSFCGRKIAGRLLDGREWSEYPR